MMSPPEDPSTMRTGATSRHMVTTVGTSLLTQPGRPFQWRSGAALPDESTVLAWLRQANPVEASAELHTIHRILEQEGESGSDQVTLLHSQTPEGWFAARMLHRHLETTGRQRGLRQVTVCEIDGLTYDEVEFMQRGLRSLARHLARLVRRDRTTRSVPVRTLFVATGGFKPESAYATLVGTLTGVDVVYLHEKFSRVVRIPALPIRWDATVLEHHRELIQWLEDEPRPEREARERLRHARDLASFIEYPGDGHAYLNAIGLLLLECLDEIPRAPNLGPPAIKDPRLAVEKSRISSVPHHRPKGVEDFVDTLCGEEWVSLVRASPGSPSTRRVRLARPEEGAFLVTYRWGDRALDLEVQTTARDSAELRWVESELEGKLQRRSLT